MVMEYINAGVARQSITATCRGYCSIATVHVGASPTKQKEKCYSTYILKSCSSIISRTPTDDKPVPDKIMKNALRAEKHAIKLQQDFNV